MPRISKSGLLWYDDKPERSLGDKVCRAIDHYKVKTGREATTVYVNPSALTGEPAADIYTIVCGERVVVVKPDDNTLAHHFYIVSEGGSQ